MRFSQIRPPSARTAAIANSLPAPVSTTAPAPSTVQVAPAPKRDARQEATAAFHNRAFRLTSLPAARGRHLAIGRLMAEGLNDDQILARLPNEPTDVEERAAIRSADHQAIWNRAIARVTGGEVAATVHAPRTATAIWDRAIAKVAPAKDVQASAEPTRQQVGGNVWDRAIAKTFPAQSREAAR